jgi:transcription termination factor Rho
LSTAGCREEKPKDEVISLSGKIEKIERISDESGTVTVTFFSEKQQQEIAGTGVVTKETEIMIDGAVSKLKDLREGDHVSGEVRVEKAGREKKQIALRIHVDRPKPAGG